MGSLHPVDPGRMKSRCWYLCATLLLVFFLVAPRAAYPEGGTWPPVGQLAGGIPYDVAVQGDHAYVAAGGALTVVDVSDPSQPRQVGYCDTRGWAHGVTVAGGYAYVAGETAGLLVIDVSNTATPVEVGYCDTRGWTYGVAVVGGHVYVAAHDAGLGVVDVSNPAAPAEVGWCDTPGDARGVVLAGGYAYVADGEAGLRVIDVSNPTAPVEVGSWDTAGYADGVALAGGYAYLADGDGLRVIDVSNPASPLEVGSCDTPGGYARGVVLAGGYAYVADGWSGLRVVDVSDPAAPVEVGYWDTPGHARGVGVADGYAYVADDHAGLRVVDVSNPTAPVEVGSWDTTGYPYDVALADGYACVADGWSGLRVIDVSNPAAPSEVGSCDPASYARGVAVADGHAYVADANRGLLVIDISNPALPEAVGSCDTPDYALGVAVSGGYAYVADGEAGLRVIDVSTPAAPVEVGYWDTPGTAHSVAVSGGYAYVADQEAGLRVIDVSTPAAPEEVGYWDTPGTAHSVAVSGGYAYVADRFGGLRVIDVSNPAAPVEVGSWDTPGYAMGVAVAGGLAYVADSSADLRVIDVSDPAALAEVGYWDTPGGARDVAVAGGYVYLAAYGWGLLIFPEYDGSGGHADLRISSCSVAPGLSTEFSAAVVNQGSSPAGTCAVDIYLDRESEPTGGERGEGRIEVPALGPGESFTGSCGLVVGGGTHRAWARVDVANAVWESDETNNTYGPVEYEVSGDPTVATAYWAFGLTGSIGVQGDLFAAKFMGLGLAGVELRAEGHAHKGLRLELAHPNDTDEIFLTRSGALGGTFTGEIGSVDVGAVDLNSGAAAAGLEGMYSMKYHFQDPLADDDEAAVISAFLLGDAVELAAIGPGSVVSPVTVPIVLGLTEWAVQQYGADYHHSNRWQAQGGVGVGFGQVAVESGPGTVDAMLPEGSAIGADLGLRIYGEDWSVPQATPRSDLWKTSEGGIIVSPGFALSPPFSIVEARPLTLGVGRIGWQPYPGEITPPTDLGMFMESEWQWELGVHAPVVEFLAERSAKTRLEAPWETVDEVLIPNTPWEALSDAAAVSLDPLWFLHGIDDTIASTLAYSDTQGDVPVAWWETEESQGWAGQLGYRVGIGAALGIGGELDLGFSGSACWGKEWISAKGEVRDGALVPTAIFTPEEPSYTGLPGLVDLLEEIVPRGIAQAATHVLRWLDVVSEMIEEGVTDIIEALAEYGEGVTQLMVDTTILGGQVTVDIVSYFADLQGVLFSGTEASSRARVPFRSSAVTPRFSAAAGETELILTLVGRVHAVAVSDYSGSPLASFPPGVVTLEVQVLSEQMMSAGLSADDLSSVRLYQLVDSVSWQEMPADLHPNGDGSITLSVGLSEPGHYAPGIVLAVVPDDRPTLVNTWPAAKEVSEDDPVEIGLIAFDAEGVDAASAAFSVDGTELSPEVLDLSDYGTHLLATSSASLTPGSHVLAVSVSDVEGHTASRETIFYAHRSNTFPDVPEGHWAWPYVEASKLAGIVQGYPDATYQPDSAVTRGQMAIYISRALAGGDAHVPTGPAQASFADVPSGDICYKYVEYAAANEIVFGYPTDGLYHPGYDVDRGQMAVFITRAIATPTGEPGMATYTPPVAPTFADVTQQPSDPYAVCYPYVEYIAEHGVTHGYPDLLYHPEYIVSRGLMAVYVARAFELPM